MLYQALYNSLKTLDYQCYKHILIESESSEVKPHSDHELTNHGLPLHHGAACHTRRQLPVSRAGLPDVVVADRGWSKHDHRAYTHSEDSDSF